MKLGVMFEPQEGMTWDRWRDLAGTIEDLGFESLWRSDHLCSIIGRTERPALEAWTSLTYLATATERLRFGALVSPATFRHPSMLALTAAAVDSLSGGRLEVGLGAGWEPNEHRAFGIPFPASARERFETLDETLTVLKTLWTEEPANFAGQQFSLENARCHPKPAQTPHPPIVVGGTGEKRALRIVAKHADDWNAHGVTPDVHDAKRAVLEAHCDAIGRDPSTIRHSVAAPVVVGASDAEIRRRIAELAELMPLRTPAFFPSERTGETAADLRARGWFAGQPEDIIGQIEAFRERGLHRVVLQQIDLMDDEWLDMIAAEILPHVAGNRAADAAPAGS